MNNQRIVIWSIFKSPILYVFKFVSSIFFLSLGLIFSGQRVALLVLPGCHQAEDKSYGDESLDCCATPLPADVVKEEAGEAGAEEASNSKRCSPEGGDKRVSLYVFWVSRHLQSCIEGTRVRGYKDRACSKAKEHQTD